MEYFREWLRGELKRRNWKQADLARAANLDSAVVSNLLNGKRGPGEDTLKAISRAFDLPVEEVFRAAGLLPPEPEQTELLKKAMFYLSELDPEDQLRVVLYLETLYTRFKYGGIRP